MLKTFLLALVSFVVSSGAGGGHSRWGVQEAWSIRDDMPRYFHQLAPPGLTIERINEDVVVFSMTRRAGDVRCSAQAPYECARYALLALDVRLNRRELFDDTISWLDILAITYWGEFHTISYAADDRAGYVGRRSPKSRAAEALLRNFFDRQTGACRYVEPRFDCELDYLVRWTSHFQHWIDSVTMRLSDKGVWIIRVNTARLTGITANDTRPGGFKSYTGWLYTASQRDLFRTGQGPNVPSVWGNAAYRVPGGAPPFDVDAAFSMVVISTPEDGVGCEVVFAIVSTANRFGVSNRCD